LILPGHIALSRPSDGSNTARRKPQRRFTISAPAALNSEIALLASSSRFRTPESTDCDQFQQALVDAHIVGDQAISAGNVSDVVGLAHASTFSI
jgi:hypothetical protein